MRSNYNEKAMNNTSNRLLWVLVVGLHGYWRLFRAYRYANLLVFATLSLPLWVVVLAVVLMREYYYCGDQG